MKMEPQDIIAIGLLVLVYLYLTYIFVLLYMGGSMSNEGGIRAKEIIVFIVGVLAGYLGVNKIKKNGN